MDLNVVPRCMVCIRGAAGGHATAREVAGFQQSQWGNSKLSDLTPDFQSSHQGAARLAEARLGRDGLGAAGLALVPVLRQRGSLRAGLRKAAWSP